MTINPVDTTTRPEAPGDPLVAVQAAADAAAKIPCPPWCALDPGHDISHTVVIATWESSDRSLSVEIESEPLWDFTDKAPELSPPTICVTFDNACETWDDLTADQARELARFLATALDRAADTLDSIVAATR